MAEGTNDLRYLFDLEMKRFWQQIYDSSFTIWLTMKTQVLHTVRWPWGVKHNISGSRAFSKILFLCLVKNNFVNSCVFQTDDVFAEMLYLTVQGHRNYVRGVEFLNQSWCSIYIWGWLYSRLVSEVKSHFSFQCK